MTLATQIALHVACCVGCRDDCCECDNPWSLGPTELGGCERIILRARWLDDRYRCVHRVAGPAGPACALRKGTIVVDGSGATSRE